MAQPIDPDARDLPPPMQNVEFKAELRDADLARRVCLALGALPVATLEQTDTYFTTSAGRLKRREVPDEPTQYIFYHRPDVCGAKVSQFTIYNESEAMLLYATHELPVWVTVRKTRELLMLGHVRIHLDQVEGLGAFLEFEAIVSKTHGVEEGRRTVDGLRRELAHALGEPISCGYSDLLASQAAAEG